MNIRFLAATALACTAITATPTRAQDELSPAEMRSLLDEREAAIVQLEASVRDLSARLEQIERIVGRPVGDAPVPARVPSVAPAAESANAPGGLAIDEAAAERALERILFQQGALLLPVGSAELAPSFTWSFSQRDYPVAQLAGDTLLVGSNVVEHNVLTGNLDARIGLPFGSQLELGMPYRSVDQDLSTRVQGAATGQTASQQSSGFGNLRIGLAKTLLRESGWRPDVVGRIVWDTGWGGDTEGGAFDSGPKSLTGSLSFVKRSDPVVFVGSAGYRTFLGDAVFMPGDEIDFSLGAALAASPSTTLFASVSNQFLGDVETAGQRIEGSGLTAASLNFGGGTIVGRGVLLNIVASMGITDDAPDYSIGVSSSMRIN